MIYFDTNVYNQICDWIGNHPIPSNSLFLEDNTDLFLSPINIIEIGEISDELRRERIIRIFQELCQEKLLADTEHLIVDFIAENTDIPDIQDLGLQDPFNRTSLAEVWLDIKHNSAKTFIFERDIKEKLRIFKQLAALYHAFLSRGGHISGIDVILPDLRKQNSSTVSKAISDAISTYRSMQTAYPLDKPMKECMGFLVSTILCIGLTPFPDIIDTLWERLRLSTIEAKFDFLSSKLRFLLSEGPLVGMAAVMATQATNKYDRGNLFDCYHIAYLPYVDKLFTLDSRLLKLRTQYPNSWNLAKIVDANHFLSWRPNNA